jgi:hypothetical protein
LPEPTGSLSLLDKSNTGTYFMSGMIFNSLGLHVGVIRGGNDVYNVKNELMYRVKGMNIYRLTGELVGHFTDGRSADKRLDKATDKLFAW